MRISRSGLFAEKLATILRASALARLRAAGIDALGFDPLGPGVVQGSSHGSCRVFRRFNFENENYA